MALKIYTKTGDHGETSLFGGKRLPKFHVRIEAYGTVDELNSWLGLLRDSLEANNPMTDLLKSVQDTLFVVGSHLASEPGKKLTIPAFDPADTKLLEEEIDRMEQVLPPLKNFILPGGHPVVSYCHVARCVCRRAERRVVELSTVEVVNVEFITYLNRLSDFLFVLSRKIAHDLGAPEIAWKPRG